MSDWKRRAKAAAALAGTTDVALAKEFGISVATYNRRLQPKERAPEQMQAEVLARWIARRCELPYEFFTIDWSELARREREYLNMTNSSGR